MAEFTYVYGSVEKTKDNKLRHFHKVPWSIFLPFFT